jgi:hypothetical protein
MDRTTQWQSTRQSILSRRMVHRRHAAANSVAVRHFDCQGADGAELRLDVEGVVLLKLGGSGVLAGL